MQVDETRVGDGGSGRLIAKLHDAIARARSCDYDLPSEAAMEQSYQLFLALERSLADLRAVEVSIGIDGSVDLFAAKPQYHVSIEISPAGTITLLSRESTGPTAVEEDPSIAEIVRELKRAA